MLFRPALIRAVLFSATACDNGYPIAPTACDDYCLAAEGLNCPNDKPEQCVNGCVHSISPNHIPECRELFDRALSCLQAASPDAFHCVHGNSQPREPLCVDELVPLLGCARVTEDFYETCFSENGVPRGAPPEGGVALHRETDSGTAASSTANSASASAAAPQ